MSDENPQPDCPAPALGELPLKALAVMVVLAAVVAFYGMLGGRVFAGGVLVLLTDGTMALMVLLAAGGYGRAVLRAISATDGPPLLSLSTAAALGLWVLSIAVLVVGSAVPAALSMMVWWPVIGGGVALALWQAHGPLGRLRLPGRLPGGSLVWVIAAAGAGMCLAGAVLPAGWPGNLSGMNPAMAVDSTGNLIRAGSDSAALLGRHLQLPREFYEAGGVRALGHNVYSHGPLTVEMLNLLAMGLRGGAREGMVLAQLICGLFAALAVAGVAGGLKDDDFRARSVTALLAAAPWVIYLGWVGLPELASLCYLTLALLWLREWMRRPSARIAACIGLMLGSAVGAGWAAAGMVVAPLLAVMLVVALRARGRLKQTVLAAAVAAAMAAPWLIRTAAATGNPVFPLAASTLGRGHWDEQAARRWRDAHALTHRPPVPPPRGERPPPHPTRRERFTTFLAGPWLARRMFPDRPIPLHTVLGAGILPLLLGTLLGMFARPRGPSGWDWALLGVLGGQWLTWAALTGGMPARTASVCVVPISLLCAGGLSRLAGVREVRWLRQSPGLGGRWGLAPAALLLLATVLLSLMGARRYWVAEKQFAPYSVGYRAAGAAAGAGRMALIGEQRPFYFPAGCLYATAFDPHPLAESFRRCTSGADLAGRLRARGVTHVYVDWASIEHAAQTVGWPAEMSAGRLAELLGDWPVVQEYRYAPAPPSAETAPATRPANAGPLMFTLYAVPAAAPATQTAPSPALDTPRPVG